MSSPITITQLPHEILEKIVVVYLFSELNEQDYVPGSYPSYVKVPPKQKNPSVFYFKKQCPFSVLRSLATSCATLCSIVRGLVYRQIVIEHGKTGDRFKKPCIRVNNLGFYFEHPKSDLAWVPPPILANITHLSVSTLSTQFKREMNLPVYMATMPQIATHLDEKMMPQLKYLDLFVHTNAVGCSYIIAFWELTKTIAASIGGSEQRQAVSLHLQVNSCLSNNLFHDDFLRSIEYLTIYVKSYSRNFFDYFPKVMPKLKQLRYFSAPQASNTGIFLPPSNLNSRTKVLWIKIKDPISTKVTFVPEILVCSNFPQENSFNYSSLTSLYIAGLNRFHENILNQFPNLENLGFIICSSDPDSYQHPFISLLNTPSFATTLKRLHVREKIPDYSHERSKIDLFFPLLSQLRALTAAHFYSSTVSSDYFATVANHVNDHPSLETLTLPATDFTTVVHGFMETAQLIKVRSSRLGSPFVLRFSIPGRNFSCSSPPISRDYSEVSGLFKHEVIKASPADIFEPQSTGLSELQCYEFTEGWEIIYLFDDRTIHLLTINSEKIINMK